jgi:hypothetical protein
MTQHPEKPDGQAGAPKDTTATDALQVEPCPICGLPPLSACHVHYCNERSRTRLVAERDKAAADLAEAERRLREYAARLKP